MRYDGKRSFPAFCRTYWRPLSVLVMVFVVLGVIVAIDLRYGF